MMKLLTDDEPILSLIISPPDLRTVDEEELRNSHTLLNIVCGRTRRKRGEATSKNNKKRLFFLI
jgi:hypothetical protein